MNDATTAMLKDWAGKGVSTVLSGAGGAVAKMALNLIFEGTTDPTAEALNRINEQLVDIKGQIKELPDAVSIYQAYNQAILDAQLKVSQFRDMLYFTADRKKIYKTFDEYIVKLVDEQWKTMESFLIPGVKDNANTQIINILKTAYGLDKQDITESEWPKIKFGDSQRSYARLRSSADLQKLPANFQEYVSNQVFIKDTVILAISGIVSAAQTIINVFQRVDIEKLSEKNRKRIQGRLANEEIKAGYLEIDQELKVPKIYADLLRPLTFAPVYLCGNALDIYNGILDGKSFTLQNVSTKEYATLGGRHTLPKAGVGSPSRVVKQYDEKGNQEYFSYFYRTEFSNKGTAWKIGFVDKKKTSVVTLKSPDLGYLFIHGISNVPGVTTKGELANKGYSHWKLNLVPRHDADSGHKNFCFTLDNVEKEKALVNESPFIGSDHLGYWKLDHFDGNHQWFIQETTSK